MKKLKMSQLATVPIGVQAEVGHSPITKGFVQTAVAAGMKFTVSTSLSLPAP